MLGSFIKAIWSCFTRGLSGGPEGRLEARLSRRTMALLVAE